jgi:hypothetical protein
MGKSSSPFMLQVDISSFSIFIPFILPFDISDLESTHSCTLPEEFADHLHLSCYARVFWVFSFLDHDCVLVVFLYCNCLAKREIVHLLSNCDHIGSLGNLEIQVSRTFCSMLLVVDVEFSAHVFPCSGDLTHDLSKF